MKIVLLFCLILAVYAQEKYESLNENFDVAEALSNDRLLHSYANCLLNKGPCTPDAKKVKDKLPEALATRCAKCTDKQKEAGKQLVQGVKNNHPNLWKELVNMYDPDGKHQEAFKDFFESI